MPATPLPISGPLGPVWSAIFQAAQANKQKAANLAGQAQQGATYGGYGNANVTSVSGSNLLQIVQLGATYNTATNTPVSGFPQGGVPAASLSTGLGTAASPVSGMAVPTAIATGLITLTGGSTAATLVSTITGSFVNGMQIGAYTINLTTGVTTIAITPGTTFTITGSAITLSAAALTGGTSLYCVAATFSQVT